MMSVRLLAVAMLGIYGSAFAQTYSFSRPAMPLRGLLPELSKELGVQLEYTSQVENDVLLLRFTSASKQEILDKIAEATYAEWKETAGGMRLTRSSDRLRDTAGRAETSARAAKIKEALAKDNEALKRLPTFDEQYAKVMARRYHEAAQALQRGGKYDASLGGVGNPPISAIIELLTTIGPEELAKIRPGQRVVFSSAANSMQKRFPANSFVIVQRMVKLQGLYNTEFSKLQENKDQRVMFGGGGPYVGSSSDYLKGAGEALLAVTTTSGSLSASLMVNDAAGNHFVSANHSLTFSAPDRAPASEGSKLELLPSTTQFAKTLIESQTVSSGPQIRSMSIVNGRMIMFESQRSMGAPPKLAAEIEAQVLDPLTREPLALVGEVLSRSIDGNIVALIHDGSLSPAAAVISSGSATKESLPTFLLRAGLRLRESSKWTVIEPLMPESGIRRRADRKSIKALTTALKQRGYLRLTDLAAYANANVYGTDYGDITTMYLRVIDPVAAGRAFSILQRPAVLNAFSTMPLAMQRKLMSGGTVALRDLSPTVRMRLSEEFYGDSFDGPKKVPAGQKWAANTFYSEGLANDVTELLPNGIPAGAFMSLQFESTPAVYGTNSSSGESSFLTPQKYASTILQGEISQFSNVGPAPTYDRFKVAHQERFTFLIQLAEDVQFGREMDDFYFEENAPSLAFEQLPQSFRDAIKEQLEFMRQAFTPIRGGVGKPNIPPSL